MSFLCSPQSYRWLKMVLIPFLVFNLILNTGVVSSLEASPSFSSSVPISFKDLSLPGMIQGKNYQSNSKNNIFLIRDLHCQPEAQEKIAQSILALNQKGIDQVFVEGAEGPLRTLLYQSFPDSNIRKNVARKFLNQGYLTGAEFAVISEGLESKIDLIGVENSEIYLENFKAFRQTRLLYQKLKNEIESFDQWLESLKKKSYSKKLLLLDQAQKGMSSNKFSLEKIIALLEKTDLDKSLKTNELWWLNTAQKEIDSEKVQKEHNDLLQLFQNRLSREELQNVVRRSLEYRLGKLSALKHFSFLKNIFEEKINKSSFKSQYPTLEIWINFLQRQEKIDFDKAYLNLSQLIDEQIKKQADQEKVENIVKVNEQWRLLQKWINLELSRKELVETVEKSPQELFKQLESTLVSLKPPSFSKDWNLLIQEAQHFYELAQKRDQILLDNALKNMNKAAQRTTILITGGFHTEGIQKLLETKGISYTTWTPQVNGDISSDLYEKIMMDDTYDLENVEFSEKRLVGHSSSEIQKMLQNPVPTGNIWAQIGEGKRHLLENMMADDLREGLAQGRSPRQIFEGWLSRFWDGLNEQEHKSLRALFSKFVNFPEADASNATQTKIWLDMMNKAFGEDSVLTQIVREYFESLQKKKDELAPAVAPLVVMSELTKSLINDLESAATEDKKLKDVVLSISNFLTTFHSDKWLRIPKGKEVFISLVKSCVITEKNFAEFLNWMDRVARLRSASAVIEVLEFITFPLRNYPEEKQASLLECLEKLTDKIWIYDWKTRRTFTQLLMRGIDAQVLYGRELNLALIVDVMDQIEAKNDSFKGQRFEVLDNMPEDLNMSNRDWFMKVIEVISQEKWIRQPMALSTFSSVLTSGAKTEENLENSRAWFQELSEPYNRKTTDRYRLIVRLVAEGALTVENVLYMKSLLKGVIDQDWLGSLWGPSFLVELISKKIIQRREDIEILNRIMNRYVNVALVYRGLEALLLNGIVKLENEAEIQSIPQEDLTDLSLLVEKDSFGYRDFSYIDGVKDRNWESISQDPFLRLRIAYLKKEGVDPQYPLKDRARALLLNHANDIVCYSSDLAQEYGNQSVNPHLLPGMISLRSKLRFKENEGKYSLSDLLKDLKVDESQEPEILALMEEMGYRVDDKGFIVTSLQLVTTIYRGSLEVDSQEAKYVTHAVTTALCHYARKGGEAAAAKGGEEVVAIGNKALHEIDYVLMNYEGRDDKKVDANVSVAFSYDRGIPQYARKQIYLLEGRSVLGLLDDIRNRQAIERKGEEKLSELLNQVVKGIAKQSELENIIKSILSSLESMQRVETNYYFEALYGYLDNDFFEELKKEYKEKQSNEELIVRLTQEAQDRQVSRLRATKKDVKVPRYEQHLGQLDNRNKIWTERRLTLWGYLRFKNDMRKGTYEENKIEIEKAQPSVGQIGKATPSVIDVNEQQGRVYIAYENGESPEHVLVGQVRTSEVQAILARHSLAPEYDFIRRYASEVQMLVVEGLLTPTMESGDGKTILINREFWIDLNRESEEVIYNALLHMIGEAAARDENGGRQKAEALLKESLENEAYKIALVNNKDWIQESPLRKWHYYLRYQIQSQDKANDQLTALIQRQLKRSVIRLVAERKNSTTSEKLKRDIQALVGEDLESLGNLDEFLQANEAATTNAPSLSEFVPGVDYYLNFWKEHDAKNLDGIFEALKKINFFESPEEEGLLKDTVKKLGLSSGQKYLHVGSSLNKVVLILALQGVHCTYININPSVLDSTRTEFQDAFEKLAILGKPPVRYLVGNIDYIISSHAISTVELGSFDVITLFHIMHTFKGIIEQAIKNVFLLARNRGRVWFTPKTYLYGSGDEMNMAVFFQRMAARVLPEENIYLKNVSDSDIRDLAWGDYMANQAFLVLKGEEARVAKEISTLLKNYYWQDKTFDFARAIAEGARQADAILEEPARDQYLRELTDQLAEILKSKLEISETSLEALDRVLEAYQPLSDTAISVKTSVLEVVAGFPRSVPRILRSPTEIEAAA